MKGADHRRDFYEAWFLAYKAALSFTCLEKLLASVRDGYEGWGDVRRATFESWWRRKENLFVSSINADGVAGTITVRIPVGEKMATISRDLRRNLGGKLFKKRDSGRLRDALLFYTGYYLPHSKREPQQLGVEAIPYVLAYFKSINRAPPTTFLSQSGAGARSLKRYLRDAESAIAAVAAGTFPSDPANVNLLRKRMEQELLKERQKRTFVGFHGFMPSYRNEFRKDHKRMIDRNWAKVGWR